MVITDHKPSGDETIGSKGLPAVWDCYSEGSDKVEVDDDTTQSCNGSLEKCLPTEQADPNHEAPWTQTHPPIYIKDEIDLKPTSPLPGKTLACKNRDRQNPGPSIIKKISKKIQLHRRRSLADLFRAGEGPSYGLPENDYSQPEQSDLKITSVVGGYSENHDDVPVKQEPKEETPSEINGGREGLFSEIEKKTRGALT